MLGGGGDICGGEKSDGVAFPLRGGETFPERGGGVTSEVVTWLVMGGGWQGGGKAMVSSSLNHGLLECCFIPFPKERGSKASVLASSEPLAFPLPLCCSAHKRWMAEVKYLWSNVPFFAFSLVVPWLPNWKKAHRFRTKRTQLSKLRIRMFCVEQPLLSALLWWRWQWSCFNISSSLHIYFMTWSDCSKAI